ncbi:MAG: cyclopropane fatty acyl phospholipid synthase [Bdellovibrionales bacterium]|nr:cyclopropane fatty acyl phospholipid synthase [Bdellovibrionales bacterium]
MSKSQFISSDTYRNLTEQIFSVGEIALNGSNPWDITVHDERMFRRFILEGRLGIGEAYMDGWWDCAALDELIFRMGHAERVTLRKDFLKRIGFQLYTKCVNLQTRARARQVAREHYNLGNDVFMKFLDPYNQYTCGFFEGTTDLNVAQEHKLDVICQKLELSEKDHVLDIGCGWGGFAKFAAERYGCKVTGISISESQLEYAHSFCKDLPVDLQFLDYRDLRGTFDKILVCGMIEHVGPKNYRALFEAVKRCLKTDGLFLLHTIGSNPEQQSLDPWIHKYIFPNALLPSMRQLTKASDGILRLEDQHNFGHYYDDTLMAWNKNFECNWQSLSSTYDERFRRMFRYYFLTCAGYFRCRRLQLWQLVFSPYRSLRKYKGKRDFYWSRGSGTSLGTVRTTIRGQVPQSV